MNEPTFIEVAIRDPRGGTFSVYISPEKINCFGQMPDGLTGVTMSDGSSIVLDIAFHDFKSLLRISGCRLLTQNGQEDILNDIP